MTLSGWRKWWRERRADAGALSAIALFFVCFFPHVLFGERFIIAGDALYYSYPLRTVAWRMIRHGELPLWTPYVLSGYPLLSMSQVAVGYPLTWAYFFLSGPWAEQIYVLAPFLLAPAFTYAYAREIGRSRLGALLAGLAFAYGGMMCGAIANSGMLTNSLMWTPLLLLFIDRARRRSLAHCLFWATLAYSMSVLAGHGQSYVYVGMLAVGYGLFLSLLTIFERRANERDQRAWLTWTNWRPLFVALGALLLSAGVAAFQLFESLRAARRSVRSALSYQGFGEGSFTPRDALLSVGAPLYHYVDSSAYVAPLAVLLAVTAIVCAVRGRTRDARLWFWLAVAAVAFVLMLGTRTPLYWLAYRVPILNQFRVPSRHTFEWTLAVSIIAAYGWDAVAVYFARRIAPTTRARKLDLLIALALLILGVVVGVFWWRATNTPPIPNPSIYTGLPESAYWLWKLAFTANIIALVCWCFRMSDPRTRTLSLAVAVMFGCFVEQSATVACWWAERLSLPARRLQLVSPATRYLEQFPPAANRVFTRAGLFAEEFKINPHLEAPNLPALYGLHDLAGMEPLIFERYSRALGGVGPDSVTPRAGFPPNDDLFNARSHVLDLLNTTHVVSFINLKPFEDPLSYQDGIGLSVVDLGFNLPPGATVRLTGGSGEADTLALVTTLSNSINEPQGAAVARVRLHTADGRIVEHDLRAGIDTAEWAHERADVRAIIKHALAPVFDAQPGDPANTFLANRYWTRLSLDTPQQIKQVEITNISPGATLGLSRASLYNSRAGISTQLVVDTRSEFWTTVYDQDQVQIIHNARAQPRAWLVPAAETVDGEEALRRIRGESSVAFDPRRTVLLEVKPAELPNLPGQGATDKSGQARIVSYEPTRLLIETDAPTATVLVLSEIFYPGWEARVDGQDAPILLADYLLRGVALPAGKHTVEMRYAAPAARTGAIISVCTLLLLCGLFVYQRRAAKR